MKTTVQALEDGFTLVPTSQTSGLGYRSFKFGDGYELCFEPLLFDGQMYVALYKDQQLLTEKVVVKAGMK